METRAIDLRPVWCVMRVSDANPAKSGYCAGLWIKPYTGFRLAVTRTVRTEAQARRDGLKAFGKEREDPYRGDSDPNDRPPAGLRRPLPHDAERRRGGAPGGVLREDCRMAQEQLAAVLTEEQAHLRAASEAE